MRHPLGGRFCGRRIFGGSSKILNERPEGDRWPGTVEEHHRDITPTLLSCEDPFSSDTQSPISRFFATRVTPPSLTAVSPKWHRLGWRGATDESAPGEHLPAGWTVRPGRWRLFDCRVENFHHLLDAAVVGDRST
jgi:hypothetical protein